MAAAGESQPAPGERSRRSESSPTPSPDDQPVSRPRKQSDWFVGARQLPAGYTHISDANLKRLFQENPTPEVPVRGYAEVKYRRWVERNQLSVVPEAEAADSQALAQRKRRRDEDAADFNISLTKDDDNILWGFVKNRMLHRMHWKNNMVIDACIMDALGISFDHPEYKSVRATAGRNRDTWQGRVLNNAHVFARDFLRSETGKQKVIETYKGKKMYIWALDTEGKMAKQCLLIDATLFPPSYSTLETAKAVFACLLPGLDITCLEDAQKKPTYLGHVLIKKALSYIQLETSYIIDMWLSEEGEYTKGPDDRHNRQDNHLDYIATIDALTMPSVRIPSSTQGEDIELGCLFDIPSYSSFESRTRLKKKSKISAVANGINLSGIDAPTPQLRMIVTEEGFYFVDGKGVMQAAA
ncbi:hypothetical protein BJ508DRAFT_326127 [Ascobolus immersus RN42]|uniref:Uncharacterized protein n=1 Tax=Ascobolus immersus RN42 TaxID=1160509 RepID=A0A3N4IJ53_ASCIM|nr:hypothetical protein BJ508DRAFT_326127 [Ascobolus immersus RN42]